jgi:hypothetical protein
MTDIAETGYEETEGRCQAVDEAGVRCPNPAEPGSRYCGRPEHQSLEDVQSDHVVAPAAELAEGDDADAGPVDVVEQEPGVAPGMATEPGPFGGLDEGAEEAAAGEAAAAIGGRPEPDPGGDEEGNVDPAERAVVEGGGEAAGQEQADEELRHAVEDADEADLTADGQGFDEPTRRP